MAKSLPPLGSATGADRAAALPICRSRVPIVLLVYRQMGRKSGPHVPKSADGKAPGSLPRLTLPDIRPPQTTAKETGTFVVVWGDALVHGDVEVLADETYVAALGCLGAVSMAEDPLVGLPVAVAVTGGRHVGCSLGARAVGARRQRHHHLEAAVVDHAGRVVERGVEDFDDRTRRHAKRLDARGVELAALDLPTMRHEQDKVARAQVELTRAVVLQAVETRVVAVAPAELEGTATKHEKAQFIGILDALELRRTCNVLAALGDGRGRERLEHGRRELRRNVIPNVAIGFELGIVDRVDMYVHSCS